MKKLTYKYNKSGNTVKDKPNAVNAVALALTIGVLVYILLTQF